MFCPSKVLGEKTSVTSIYMYLDYNTCLQQEKNNVKFQGLSEFCGNTSYQFCQFSFTHGAEFYEGLKLT